MENDLILRFESEEAKNKFLAWWYDAGGDQTFWEFCDTHSLNVDIFTPQIIHPTQGEENDS